MSDVPIQITKTTVLKEVVRSGTDAKRRLVILSAGELGYTTDTKRLFTGDGTSFGGLPASPVVFADGISSPAAAVARTDILTGDLFQIGNPDGFAGELAGLYLRTSSGVQYLGPDFNTDFFEVVDGKISLTAQASTITVNTGLTIPSVANIALDGSYWTLNSTTGKLTVGQGITGESDHGMGLQLVPSKTGLEAGVVYSYNSSIYGLFGGTKGRIILANTTDAASNARVIETIGVSGSLRFASSGTVETDTDTYFGVSCAEGGMSGLNLLYSSWSSPTRTTSVLGHFDVVGGLTRVSIGAAYDTLLTQRIQLKTNVHILGELHSTGKLVTEDNTGTLNSLLPVGDGVLSRTSGVYSMVTNARIETATVVLNASPVVPSGYFKCNGQAVSRTTYAALFAKIGTTFGIGDGSTTFNVPTLADLAANVYYMIKN